MHGNGDRCIRLVIRVDSDAIEQRFPGAPLRNHLEGVRIPDTQSPPDPDRNRDNPAPPTPRKEPDVFYSCVDGCGYDVVKRCQGGSPVKTEFVGAQCLSFEIFDRKRCQRTFREWDAISEDIVRAGGLPNGVLLGYQIESSRYLLNGRRDEIPEKTDKKHSFPPVEAGGSLEWKVRKRCR